jgi:hypothetical protein
MKGTSGLGCGDDCILAADVVRLFLPSILKIKLLLRSLFSFEPLRTRWVGELAFCLVEKLQVLLGKLCSTRNVVPLQGSTCKFT